MKNRKKALIIAIICLAAAAVLYLLVVELSQRSEDADSSDDSLVISSVDSGQITAISYEKDGKSLSFRKEDGTWYYAADTGELQGGIMKINGNVYYFDSNSCKLQTGERTFNGQTHTFTENGTTDGGPYVYTEWNSNGTLRRGTKFGVR